MYFQRHLGRVIHADLLLLGVEAHALGDVLPAAPAPHVEGHLEANDQDALRRKRTQAMLGTAVRTPTRGPALPSSEASTWSSFAALSRRACTPW